MSASILVSTKKILGLDPENEDFDLDIMTHINSVFSILHQLGIGPINGFMIEDAGPTWTDFLSDVPQLNNVKSYVYLRVRLLFDPPTTSYLIENMKSQMQEIEWRINVFRENLLLPAPVPEVLE